MEQNEITELRINLRGSHLPLPTPEGDRARRTVLAVGDRFAAAMARVHLANAEARVRHLPRIHFADHLTGDPGMPGRGGAGPSGVSPSSDGR